MRVAGKRTAGLDTLNYETLFFLPCATIEKHPKTHPTASIRMTAFSFLYAPSGAFFVSDTPQAPLAASDISNSS